MGLGSMGRAGWSWGEAPGPYAELARSLRGAYAWHSQIPCAFWLLLCCATCEIAAHYKSHAMLHKHPTMLAEFRTVVSAPCQRRCGASRRQRTRESRKLREPQPCYTQSFLDWTFAIVLHHVCHIDKGPCHILWLSPCYSNGNATTS